MNKKELEFILQKGEGSKIEFKESFDKSIAKDMVAFVNAKGGRIFLGITDKNEPKGINITNRLKSQIQDLANNCDPLIKIKLETFKNICIINILKGVDKPYKCSSGFYLRQGSISQKMSREEIFSFAISEGKIKFDEQINNRFNFRTDFDKERLNNYLKLAKISKTRPIEKILSDLDVGKKNKILKFNNAGVLFFAKEPQKFIPHSVFTCVLFRDKEGSEVIDRKEIKGGLVQIVENVMEFVKFYVKVAYKFTGKPQRENVYEYSLEAIREAVINSVMHKDYFESGHNNLLKIFPNRIQVENVWEKPSHFKLKQTVFRRNPLIADLFSRIHFGEKLGSGLERMEYYCKREKAPIPQIKFTNLIFYITFKQSFEYVKLSTKGAERGVEKGVEKVSENERIIINLIKNKPYISKNGMITDGKLTKKAVEWNIKKLKQKGLIKRIGPDKGGYWKIIEK